MAVIYYGARFDPEGGLPETRKFSSLREAEEAGFGTITFRWDTDKESGEEVILRLNVEIAKLSEKH